MNHLKAVFFLLAFGFSFFLAHGQEFVLKGAVVDAESREALPFASIMVLNHNMGATTDLTGNFTLILREDLFNDTLVISYLGYHTEAICICDLGSGLIKLNPKVIQLEIFHFSPVKKKSRVLYPFNTRNCFVPYSNEFSKNQSSWLPYRPHEPTIEALYFPFHLVGNKNALIKEVRFFTKSLSTPAFFRLRVLQADENQKPANDLITENIIVEVKRAEELVRVNLENYHLNFPENGIFIGFELMLRPENKKTVLLPDNSGSVVLYSPYLQYYEVKNADFSYWLYAGGKWTQHKKPSFPFQPEEIIKPAIALVVEQ